MEFIKELKEFYASVMDLIRPQVRDQMQNYISNLVKIEFDNHLKRTKYARIKPKANISLKI